MTRLSSRHSFRAVSIALALLVGAQPLAAQSVADPMLPGKDERIGTTSPLRMVTVTTGDMAATRRFYVDGLGMTATPVVIDRATATQLARHWGAPAGRPLQIVLFSMPGTPGSASVRAVAVPPTLLPARPGYDSRYLGPLGFGFPSSDLPAREQTVKEVGYRSSAGVMRMDFPRADGTKYNVGEIHFRAPDDVLVLGVDRGEMRPVGPLGAGTRTGGVAYASALVGDIDRANTFLGKVVGLHRRRTMQFESGGPGGGMVGLDKGEPIAFEQWFSGGSSTGYLVIMQRLKGARTMPQVRGFDARGVALWSFETSELDAAVARHRAAGGTATVSRLRLPGFGLRRAAVLRSPDNLAIELVEVEGRK